VKAFIRGFANENGWRARKVRAELAKLGISVSPATVSRYLPKRDPDHGQRQRWQTFLRNHKHGITAMDFLVVPTARFRLLYAWFVIGHGRREIIHFGVTEHPTSSCLVQHLREAFPSDHAHISANRAFGHPTNTPATATVTSRAGTVPSRGRLILEKLGIDESEVAPYLAELERNRSSR
jgi:hypothetical protein